MHEDASDNPIMIELLELNLILTSLQEYNYSSESNEGVSVDLLYQLDGGYDDDASNMENDDLAFDKKNGEKDKVVKE